MTTKSSDRFCYGKDFESVQLFDVLFFRNLEMCVKVDNNAFSSFFFLFYHLNHMVLCVRVHIYGHLSVNLSVCMSVSLLRFLFVFYVSGEQTYILRLQCL